MATSDRDRDRKAERHGRQRDPFDVAAAGGEGEQHAGQRHHDRQHQQRGRIERHGSEMCREGSRELVEP